MDLKDIKAIVDLMKKNSISEFELERQEFKIRLKRSANGVITDTVARWDAEETSQKIELQVGKDLQFIRINGTVVGSLAGLVIYSIAQLLF